MVRNRKALLCAFCLYFCMGVMAPQQARADWFSELTDNLHSNSQAAWEGQKRGYFTGGGLSLRIKTSREPLLNLQAPRISAGCGGIDAFWGSFAYLNPEYLVQMFQNILAAAPAYAFKLALSQLCDPCDDVMSALQQLAQAVNNAALDECGTAQALVNLGGDTIAEMIGMDANKSQSEFGTWISEKANKLTAGVEKFNSELRKLQQYQFCGGFTNHDDYDRCANFTDITGSLWEKAKKVDRTSGNVPDEAFFRLARALFGEMVITPAKPGDDENKSVSMFSVDYYEPCPTTTAKVVITGMLGNFVVSPEQTRGSTPNATLPSGEQSEALVTTPPSGTVDIATEESQIGFRDIVKRDDRVIGVTACQRAQMPDSLRVYKRATEAIQAINWAMQTNPQTTLDTAVIEVVLESSLPVYQIINTLAYRGFYGGSMTAEEMQALIKLTSIGYTQYLLTEFVGKAEAMLDGAYIQLSTSQTSAPVNPATLEVGYQAIKKRMNAFRQELFEAFQDVQQTYMVAFKQTLEFHQMRDYYQSLLKTRGLASAFTGI